MGKMTEGMSDRKHFKDGTFQNKFKIIKSINVHTAHCQLLLHITVHLSSTRTFCCLVSHGTNCVPLLLILNPPSIHSDICNSIEIMKLSLLFIFPFYSECDSANRTQIQTITTVLFQKSKQSFTVVPLLRSN